MLRFERSPVPVLAFLALYLPAGSFAFGLGLWAAPHAPCLAVVLQVGLGVAAFAVAVEGAAEWFLRRPGRWPRMQRLLHLRRHGLRYASVFALIGASVAGLADLAAAACGVTVALDAGPGRIALGAAGLFALAALIIGSAGARQSLIRRALGEALAQRS